MQDPNTNILLVHSAGIGHLAIESIPNQIKN